jgi:hypothetical protein
LTWQQDVNPLNFTLYFVVIGVHGLHVDVVDVGIAAVRYVDENFDGIWRKVLSYDANFESI